MALTRPTGGSLHKAPPPRSDPYSPDSGDEQRLEHMRTLWNGQTQLLKPFHRTAEEMVRMISGQQHILWSELWNRFVDITELMSEDDRLWRPRPVMNRMLPWYLLTTARLTENPPIVTFQPARPDRMDADLAEVWDILHKREWRHGGAPGCLERVVQWMVATGQGFWKIRLNPSRGTVRRFEGPALLPWVDPRSGQQSQLYVERVPYGPDGQPRAQMVSETEYEITGPPHEMREGEIEYVDLSPFEVRSEWNHGVPFHRREWHYHRTFLTPEQVFDLYGVEVEPDLRAEDSDNATEMRRILFGTGNFAQVSPFSWEIDSGVMPGDLVTVDELWQRPCGKYPEDEANGEMGGRLTVALGRDMIAYDGPRPFNFPHTSPIHSFPFVQIPGRPGGSTPAEYLAPIQKGINRGMQQLLEFRNLMSNPKTMVDIDSGLVNTERTNKPGEELHVRMRPGVIPYQYVQPPTVSGDVWRVQQILDQTFTELSGLEGARGAAPTTDPSGELVKELRFNSDRYFGSPAKHMVEEIARSSETVMAIIRVAWDREKVINYVGADNIHRTITVYPEMLKAGKVNVIPDVESMLPESRSERQERAAQAFQLGMFGDPAMDPGARRRFAEVAKFPHPYRSNMPGETDRVMAQRELGQLLEGAPVAQIPMFEWYDDEVHAAVFEEYMKGPDFLKQEQPIQAAIVLHWKLHVTRLQAKLMAAAAAQAQMGGGDGEGGGENPPPKQIGAGAAPPPQVSAA